ncbi:MAG: isoprenyl transferase [Lactobacillaceae bacterium]|nr:isoprenyl transferase [Lactobacillaceae bacterium]
MSSKDNKSKTPQHIAIIMDGNGRWATKRGLPRALGHKKGAEAVEEVVKGAKELGVKYLTLYAFSTENWNRDEDEVKTLMGLLREYLKRNLIEIQKNNVKIKFIGELYMLDKDIQDSIKKIEADTEKNDAMTLCIAISYGARQEILSAVKKVVGLVKRGDLSEADIDNKVFSDALYTRDIPDPDLVVRTSGEQRISNYLLWQVAYAEFYFSDVFWPDFNKKHLEKIIEDFNSRERRYGKS